MTDTFRHVDIFNSIGSMAAEGVAVAADTDFLVTTPTAGKFLQFAPRNSRPLLKITVALATSGKFKIKSILRRTGVGDVAILSTLNDNTALDAGTVYVFAVQASRALLYNFQASAMTIINTLIVEEESS